MIHVVSSRNRAAYESEILDHYRIRHDIYVGERKWMALARPDGLERDQFDNEDAIYVLAIDQGQVVGGSRLVPSLKPHLLSEVFPHLAGGAVPRGPDIFEWTRVHVIKPRREGRNRGRTTGMVFCGILEYCLRAEITALSALVEMWWLPHFQEMGWTIRPLGLPVLIEGEWSIAVLLPVDEQVLASTRRFFDIAGAALVQAPADTREIAAVLS
jgi:acyl-homoserine lactone synthase